MKLLTYILLLFFLKTCFKIETVNNDEKIIKKDTFIIYTERSKKKNTYLNFNSPKAINKIASIENEYFNNYNNDKVSRYYGTQWFKLANSKYDTLQELSEFDKYVYKIRNNNKEPDSLHCTIYAIKALKSGFGDEFSKIEQLHKKIWNKHEYAGWSIAYILTKYYNWKAYLFISSNSNEYNRCLRNFNKSKKYYVWKQPNIKIEKIYDVDKDKQKIDSLLNKNEFGWGFSEQGWHTWITRYNKLKECNWQGVPAKVYNTGEMPLFITTNFLDYKDYNSHIIVFPPKKTVSF